jgi:hypothetical protein
MALNCIPPTNLEPGCGPALCTRVRHGSCLSCGIYYTHTISVGAYVLAVTLHVENQNFGAYAPSNISSHRYNMNDDRAA